MMIATKDDYFAQYRSEMTNLIAELEQRDKENLVKEEKIGKLTSEIERLRSSQVRGIESKMYQPESPLLKKNSLAEKEVERTRKELSDLREKLE